MCSARPWPLGPVTSYTPVTMLPTLSGRCSRTVRSSGRHRRTVGPSQALDSRWHDLVLGSIGDTDCLMKFDSKGEILWHTPTPSWSDWGPSIAPDGTILVSRYRQGVVAFSPVAIRCSQPPCRPFRRAVDRDGTIYVGVEDEGGLCALTANGHLKWRFTADHPLVAGVSIGPDRTLCGGEALEDGADAGNEVCFYAIRPDGSERWRWPPARGSPCPACRLFRDGSVYFEQSMKRSTHRCHGKGEVVLA